MDIKDIRQLYAMAPQTGALLKLLQDKQGGNIFLQGQQASATPLLFASVAEKTVQTFLFVLQDTDEAGYFYHDLTQVMGTENVLFFPSSYKRSVKYGQRDSANEILRTEVLAKVSARDVKAHEALFIVSYPEALAELVISKKHLDERRLSLKTGQQQIDITDVAHTLRDYGFQEVDYVYEPGQFAVRGSILDVYSFSCEYPYRIDFFGREIDTIRTFEVQDQLSKDKQSNIEIVPELAMSATEKISFLKFLPSDTVLVAKDFAYIHDVIEHVYAEGFSRQTVTERLEGATEMEQKQIMSELNKEKSLITPYQFTEDAATFRRIEFGMNAGKTGVIATQKAKKYDVLKFKITPQPLFHKNFDLLVDTFEDYILKGYKLYILADSDKQTQRLKDIFADMDSQKARSIAFEPVNRTLHEGFTDDALKLCFFTDHQIFDRYHKYNLKSDGARAGKMALTMKELQEMEPGDFIVHVDFGIGKFGGLVRVPAGNSYQEMIRIIYQHNDKVDVSIHSLYKISKYRRADTGEPPRLSTLGTGAWDRLKEKTKKRIDYLKNFGFANEVEVVGPGINSKMDEVRSAYGLLNLKQVDNAIAARQRVANAYRKALRGVEGISFWDDMPGVRHNYSYFPIFVDAEKYGMTRDELYMKMKDQGVWGRRYFYPLISEFSTYRGLESSRPEKLPNAHKLADTVICLPMHHALKEDEISRIMDVIVR